MATWPEVVNYLTNLSETEKFFEVNQISPDFLLVIRATQFALDFDPDTGLTPKNRYQQIFVSGLALDDPDMAMVRFASPFAKKEQLSHQGLLDCMGNHLMLGYGIVGDYYALINNAPLENLDQNEILWNVGCLSAIADQLEQELNLGDHL